MGTLAENTEVKINDARDGAGRGTIAEKVLELWEL